MFPFVCLTYDYHIKNGFFNVNFQTIYFKKEIFKQILDEIFFGAFGVGSTENVFTPVLPGACY